MYYFPVPQMSAVDNQSETLREIVEARINKYSGRELVETDCVFPKATETEADRLMARNVALQEEDDEA